MTPTSFGPTSRNYFVAGSTAEELLAVQGKPDKILGLAWHYGNSTVTVYNGRVESFINKGNLKVKITDEALLSYDSAPNKLELIKKTSPEPRTLGNITVGSTKDEVLAIQGTPTELGEYRWKYGFSVVNFQNGRVVSWYNSELDPLKVKLEPSGKASTSRGYFTVGSTKDDVLAIQGTPTELGEYRWKYGFSVVNFQNGRVVSWYNSELDPLKARMK
jgi:outer membrane protein assembly factor BamE (lipoprotein component of BamABCDE complex)